MCVVLIHPDAASDATVGNSIAESIKENSDGFRVIVRLRQISPRIVVDVSLGHGLAYETRAHTCEIFDGRTTSH
jgi:hypothetical protein